MGNSATNPSSSRTFASTISSTFTKKKQQTDVEHSQSTTAVQFQKDLRRHQAEEEEYEYLTKLTTFDSHTLRLLKRRFDTIDQTIQKDGQISIEEFAKVLAMDSKSILLRRFFKFMDRSSMGSLNFRNFATALSLLSIEAPDEDKMKLSFFLYDINDDQQIDRDECTKMVKLALNEINMQLSSKQIQVIVNNTFREADLNGDGCIDYQEYKIYCKKNPRVLEPFRMDIASLVLDEQENRRGRRVSQPKLLRHWGQQTDIKRKNKMLRKIKKSVPGYMKREKIERVRSIHNAKEIMGDDNKSDQYWDNKDNLSSIKEIRASKSMDDNDDNIDTESDNNTSSSSSTSTSTTTNDDDDDDDDDDNDNNYNIPSSPGPATKLKVALSADSADRRKKKKEKYTKNKKKDKKNKNKKSKSKHIYNQSMDIKSDATKLGLNTSVPRTPPKSNEKPKIKQSELDAIERLLN